MKLYKYIIIYVVYKEIKNNLLCSLKGREFLSNLIDCCVFMIYYIIILLNANGRLWTQSREYKSRKFLDNNNILRMKETLILNGVIVNNSIILTSNMYNYYNYDIHTTRHATFEKF